MTAAEIEKMRNDFEAVVLTMSLEQKMLLLDLSTVWNKAELESMKWEAVSIWGISREPMERLATERKTR